MKAECEPVGWLTFSPRLKHLVTRPTPSHPTMADPSTQQLASLLHRADQLSTQFASHHASSFNSVQSIQSSYNQLMNLMALPDRPATRSNPLGGIKERGIAKVQEVIEEGLMAVRDDLAKMERDVEQLGGLLYECDLFLQAEGVLGYSLNPREALTHVSGLFASYQEELIRLRYVVWQGGDWWEGGARGVGRADQHSV